MIKRYYRFLLNVPLFCCFLFCSVAGAQGVFRLDSIKEEVLLDKGWKFHNGDNREWADSIFDDRNWDTLSLSELGSTLTKNKCNGIAWLRLHIKVSPTLYHKTVLFQLQQSGASQIYFNNNLIESFGKVGDAKTEIPYNPLYNVYAIQFGGDSIQVLAVRLSQNKAKIRSTITVTVTQFGIQLYKVSSVNYLASRFHSVLWGSLLIFSVFLTLSIFHWLLFIFYRKTKSNLYYGFFTILMGFSALSLFLVFISHDPVVTYSLFEIVSIIIALCFFLIVVILYSIFERKINWFFWFLAGLTIVTEIVFISGMLFEWAILINTQMCTASISGIVMIIKALRQKKQGAWIIAAGFLIFLCMIPGIILYILVYSAFGLEGNGLNSTAMFIVWIFSIPASMSIYLASDFARTNKKLSLQLIHVKQLSEQNIEKEKEKKQIIEAQKGMLEIQVKEKTSEIQGQKNELMQKNTEIIDSILYARRIQTAILPSEEMLKEALGDYLIIFKPKDVVSGDLYWCHVNGDIVVFAVADCTGHGVPGALMSMIGNSLLNEVVMDGKSFDADLILNALRSKLTTTLQQSGHTNRDGMDIALCVWNKKNNILQFAGANNRMYIISENIAQDASIQQSERVKLYNNHLMEIAGDKQPIGYQEDKMDNPFTKHIIQLRKGDTIYITSDGYIDQFGGSKDKKFTSKRLRDLLETFAGKYIDYQRMSLVQTIEDWKGDKTQTDDICILGVKI